MYEVYWYKGDRYQGNTLDKSQQLMFSLFQIDITDVTAIKLTYFLTSHVNGTSIFKQKILVPTQDC